MPSTTSRGNACQALSRADGEQQEFEGWWDKGVGRGTSAALPTVYGISHNLTPNPTRSMVLFIFTSLESMPKSLASSRISRCGSDFRDCPSKQAMDSSLSGCYIM